MNLFWIYPRHWGLRGVELQKAKISYFYSGIEEKMKLADLEGLTKYDSEIKKLEIQKEYGVLSDFAYDMEVLTLKQKNKKITKKEFKKLKNELEYKHHHIDIKTYESNRVEFIEDPIEKEIEALKVNFKFHDISEVEYDKQVATLEKLPYFNLDLTYNEEEHSVYMTYDFNEYFIAKLRADGHPGSTDEEVIDNFIRDRGRIMSDDEYKDYDVDLTSSNESTELKEYT